MKNLQIFNYNETPVSFQMGENLMINATKIAQKFGKRAQHFLNTYQTKELIQVLSLSRNLGLEDLVVVTKGGRNPGTWLHEDLALIFAQWLSPEFYLWCNDRIKELFRFGLTATEEMLLKATTDPGFVAIVIEELKKSRLKEIELQAKQEELTRQLEENAPKVAYFDNLQLEKESYDRKRTYTISKIAHSLSMEPGHLNRLLLRHGIAGKIAGNWYIPEKYKDQEIAIERITYTRRFNEETEKDEMMPTTYLVWTAKGRDLIFSLFEKR